jgi:hypothetical protein
MKTMELISGTSFNLCVYAEWATAAMIKNRHLID